MVVLSATLSLPYKEVYPAEAEIALSICVTFKMS
jgi:hypothetical protein